MFLKRCVCNLKPWWKRKDILPYIYVIYSIYFFQLNEVIYRLQLLIWKRLYWPHKTEFLKQFQEISVKNPCSMFWNRRSVAIHWNLSFYSYFNTVAVATCLLYVNVPFLLWFKTRQKKKSKIISHPSSKPITAWTHLLLSSFLLLLGNPLWQDTLLTVTIVISMSKKSSPRRQTLSFLPGSSQPLFSSPKQPRRSRASLVRINFSSRSILHFTNWCFSGSIPKYFKGIQW